MATGLLLIKSVVKAHVRKTRGGKVVQVKEYSDTRKKKTGKETSLPKGTEVVFRPKGAARARRGVIFGAKAENYHIKGKRDNEGQVINYILPKSQVISLKAFQEKGKKDTRYAPPRHENCTGHTISRIPLQSVGHRGSPKYGDPLGQAGKFGRLEPRGSLYSTRRATSPTRGIRIRWY